MKFGRGKDRLKPEDCGLVDMDEFPSWIIYEDENFLALNKPGWLVCHPSKNGPLSSLAGAARVYLGTNSLHLVSRLDRETSGVVLIAKNAAAASRAQGALESKREMVSKTYAAILCGNFDGTITISQPLSDDRASLVSSRVCCAIRKPSAKSAVSVFRSLSHSGDGGEPYTLAEVKILTGRKHQIRAHAHWAGYPVAGDKIYGPDETLYLDFAESGFTDEMGKILPIRRHALHAYRYDFSRVIEGLSISAPLQSDMLEFMDKHKIINCFRNI